MANLVDVIIRVKDAYSKQIKGLNAKLKATAKNILPSFATAFRVAGVAATAALVASVKAASDFQSQMAEVGTMLDNQSRQILPSFTKAVSSMSVAYGEGTQTLTRGLYDILSASIPASKAMGVLDVSVRAAKAGLTDTGVAADALTTILNSYQMQAEDAGDVSDLLFSIVKRGKTTFAQLAPAIGMVASNAAAAGLDIEEMGAALATMTRMGIRTEISTTSLRAIINSMIKPTDEAAAVFKDKLKMSMNAATLAGEGLSGIIDEIKKRGLTAEEVAAMFPNVRALTGINALLKGHAGLLKDVSIMQKRAGATQEAFRTNTEKFEFNFKRVIQVINEVRRIIGAAFLPMLNKMAENFVGNRKSIQEWAKSIGIDAVRFVLSFIRVIRSLTPAFIVVGKTLVGVVRIITEAFNGLSAIVETVIAGIEASVAGMGIVIGKVWGFFSEEGKAFEKASAEVLKNVRDDWNEKMFDMQNDTKDAMAGFADLGIDLDFDLLGLDPETLAAKLGEMETKIAEHVEAKFEYDQWYKENKEALDAEMFTLAEMAGQVSLDMKLAVLDKEIEAEQDAVLQKLGIKRTELAEDQKFAKLGVKLTAWENKAKRNLIMAHFHAQLTLAHGVAADLLATTVTLLGGESEAFRKRKALTIGLIAAEKALAIAKIWTANAVNPIAAAAKTAMISAQFASQIKGLQAAAGVALAAPGITTTLGAPSALGGAPLPTGAAAVPMAAAAAPVVTNIYLGGVTNQFDIERLESLEMENLDNLMTQIGQKIEDLGTAGIQMSLKIHRAGQRNEGLATA